MIRDQCLLESSIFDTWCCKEVYGWGFSPISNVGFGRLVCDSVDVDDIEEVDGECCHLDVDVTGNDCRDD